MWIPFTQDYYHNGQGTGGSQALGAMGSWRCKRTCSHTSCQPEHGQRPPIAEGPPHTDRCRQRKWGALLMAAAGPQAIELPFPLKQADSYV